MIQNSRPNTSLRIGNINVGVLNDVNLHSNYCYRKFAENKNRYDNNLILSSHPENEYFDDCKLASWGL